MKRALILVAAGIFLLLGSVNVSAQSDPFTPYDIAKIKTVIDAKLSPDGSSTAYTLNVQRNPFEDEDGDAWSELHVVDAEGNVRPFITGQREVSDIQWLPDGSGISFLEDPEGVEHESLFLIPADGGEERLLLEHSEDIDEYVWNPGGNKVAFIAKEPKSVVIEELEEQGFDQEVYEEDWRHDRVWIADLSNETPDVQMFNLDGSASEIHWSPDGQRLALALAPTPLIDDYYMYRRIRIVEAATGSVVTQIDNPGKLGEIAWSPDSEHIAFISGEDIHDTAAGRLMVANASSGEFASILNNYLGHVEDIAWKDNNTIYFLGAEGVATTFNEIRIDGSRRKVYIEGGDYPVIESFSQDESGKLFAFDVEAPDHPDEVYLYRLNRDMERLTNHNPWLDKKVFGRQEVVTWTARDGQPLQGILIYPVNYNENERYPFVLSVHGGPEAHDTNGWLTSYSDPGQVGAAKGYAVLYPNYRGSTGRGVEFAKLSQNDPAGKEFDDLVDAVKHFVDTGLVDEDKVGITGGSYGGYATAWSSTYYTEHFAAGVMFVGISDRVSKMGTTDIPWEMLLVHDDRWPWEAWDHYRETSPLYHSEKGRTPLLIMHGEDDTRVHPSQSMELYRYLKVQDNTPVRLVFYQDEGHGNSKAAARLDYNLRMLRWFDHYLKGPGGEKPGYQIEYSPEELN